MNPLIVFSLAARTRMTERSARAMAPNMNSEETQFAALQQRLQNVFPSASVVLVQQLYEGFRRRTDEFVLLAEVTHAGTLLRLHEKSRCRCC
jgi:hypothetical protein